MTALSADRPSSNRQDDLFGHAPFAESLVNSICCYPGNDGLVLALYPAVRGEVNPVDFIALDPAEAKTWCEAATSSTDGLLTLLTKFCSHTRSQTMGDWAVRLHPRLNPTWLERYVDTTACAQRLIDLRQTGVIPDTAREAVDQFLKEFEMLNAGKNPDGVGAFDD